MEEDVGVKVTVTRLRRRLSVEQSEDGGSPAPSTPTKKRGGRLAAKPQLELIDENTPVSSPRKTRRKSLATDVEEKPVTPSRRSARIKSNSSIILETQSVQATGSPRAKRAARRNSQAGSDNEGSVTPGRPPRRTRKDSTSSVEQVCLPSPRRWPDIIGVEGPQEVQLAEATSSHKESGAVLKPLPVAEMVIEEEPENEVQKAANKSKSSPSVADTEELSPNSARKSKRLLEKRNRRSGSYKTDQDNSAVESNSVNNSLNNKTETEPQESPLNKSVKSKKSNADLSDSNLSLLNNIEAESKRNQSYHNKSTSALNVLANDKNKRNRTESLPGVTMAVANDSIYISDSELSKKRKGKLDKNTSGFINNSPKNKSNTTINEKNTVDSSFLDTSSKRKKNKSETTSEDNSKPPEIATLQVVTSKADTISNKGNVNDKSDNSDVTRDMAKIFANAPENVTATIYFEDSDSNSVGRSNLNKIENLDSEDQCVPVVKHDSQESLSTEKLVGNDIIVLTSQNNIPSTDINISKLVSDDVNDSCEPMDIDETIHEEILQKSLDTLQQSNKSLNLSHHSKNEENNNSKRKSSISNDGVNTPDLSTNNKRKTSISYLGSVTPDLPKNNKRKSSISKSEGNTIEQSKEENKRNSSISNSETNGLNYSNNDKSKSLITDSVLITSSYQSKNDKRKSSITSSGTDTPDKSKNNTNNKSTLILSQLKDVSASENMKSPKLAKNEVLSKSEINEKSKQNKLISKNNLSLNDVKGTPKQTSIQKLTMQTSTPINTQQLCIKTKIEEQKKEGSTKCDFSKSLNDSDSSEASSDEDNEPSVEKSNLIDDEAEEASDDYESGDSQDEEDKKYEAENEIVERGETLTSNDDVSNDTDYEKDSFVVSSDEEDNDLLSGSGDDLSMSDKELTMSKKSKEKFNERKLKEQKNASREMFESRHKLNTSDPKSPTPKTKKNRMRIDSSLLASDEEVVVNPKKSNRMRLDSSLNESAKLEEPNLSLNKSNKDKSKQGSDIDMTDGQGGINTSLKNYKSMGDCIGDKSATDEKEITVFNESNISNSDPLQVLVKQEPKTPQKDLNMSIVQFTDRAEIENVQVTEGNSIINQTGTDPLQATMACEDSTDSSESEEILQNYDSVLNELNKENKTNFNKYNVSLNSVKKSKNNQMEPIIDQLNLTKTKKLKNKDNKGASEMKTVKALKEKQVSDSEDSSASIDLQLLFSEDNCSSDHEQKAGSSKADDDNMFIPLKKSPGKINIRDSIGMNRSQENTDLNESSKKKNNRKSSQGPAESVDEQGINTTRKDTSLNESSKKKNKRKSSLVPTAVEEDKDEVDNHSYLDKSNSKNKKQRSSLTATESKDFEDILNVSKNISMNESGIKKKKKHSISEPTEDDTQDTVNVSKNVNISMNESGLKKKKKHSISEPAIEETHDTLNVSKNINISLNESGIKKKKKHSISEPAVEENQDTLNVSKNINVSMNESGVKKKKKHSISEPAVEETHGMLNISKNINNSLNESGIKKKKKHSTSEPAVEENQDILNVSKNVNISVNESSVKKKKKHSISEPDVVETQEAPDTAESEINESTKKKKKRKSSLPDAEPEGDLFFIDTTGTLQDNKDAYGVFHEPPLKTVHESRKQRKKLKLKLDRNESEQNREIVEESNPPITPNEKKKKKQKLETLARDDDSDGAPDEAPYKSEKASEMDLQNIETANESADSAKKKHKKKKKNKSALNHSGENKNTENIIPSNSKKRKRKSSNTENSQVSEDIQESVETGKHDELVGSNKKRKISHNEDNTSGSSESKNAKKNKKKNRDGHSQDTTSTSETIETQDKKNKKRKHRDDDGDSKQTKVKKESSSQEVHLPRLPDSILRQLDDKPRKIEPTRVISTSNFIVENARQKRAKPSNYLEESIYIDEKSPINKKQKQRIKKPKVLPFIPTASISDSGFTTNFKINKRSQTTTFEAEPVVFSKETYLQKNNIKRLGTYDRYKKQMHYKLSKF